MYFLAHVREALRNLRYAKLRSALAMLGIVVGTGSVVALISSSELATQHALAQFKSLGTQLLSLTLTAPENASLNSGQQQTLTADNIQHIARSVRGVDIIAPYATLFGDLQAANKSSSAQVLTGDDSLIRIAKIKLAKGRYVSALDRQRYFCDIGADLAKKFTQRGINPIGQQVLFNKHYLTVVGVLKPWQPTIFLYSDLDHGLLIPLETAYQVSPTLQINNVLFHLKKNAALTTVQAGLLSKFKTSLPGWRLDFRNPAQIIDVVAKQRATFTWLLGAIGSIALIVGGIGVMNIMLVSVIERRREIGIRLAIGASGKDILLMFLIESIILTIFGGIVGIILGVAISWGIAAASKWAFMLFPMPILLGFMVSVCVGVLSGFYPALSASRLDPIQSLGNDT